MSYDGREGYDFEAELDAALARADDPKEQLARRWRDSARRVARLYAPPESAALAQHDV